MMTSKPNSRFLISVHDGYAEYSIELITDKHSVEDVFRQIHKALDTSKCYEPEIILRQPSEITDLIRSLRK